MHRDVVFIGSASGWGAPDARCGDGPLALAGKGLLPCFGPLNLRHCPPLRVIHPPAVAADPQQIVTVQCARVSDAVQQVITGHGFPIVIGGDHSCAIGTWSGVHRATRHEGAIGLIWLDAHMDAHMPQTSHSGQLHGMPLACLMGFGDPSLAQLGGDTQSIHPHHVCLLGVRSFEAEEQALLQHLGVRVITMDEIRANGFAAAWNVAVAIASRGTCGFGLSIDLDGIDPSDAPGVGSPVAQGIRADELLPALQALRESRQLLALEITEYNPYLDQHNATGALLARLISAVAN